MATTACMNKPDKQQSIINLKHLKYLYADTSLADGTKFGVIHIYSEYPDYSYNIEPDEGYTCVDDVARTLVFLAGHASQDNDPELDFMINQLTAFILRMQADNGYFHNFIWHDLSINKSYKTSLAEANWWSWRALWALAEAYPHLSAEMALKTESSADKIISVILADYLDIPKDTILYEDVVLPNWFPMGTAFDQSALLMMAMMSYLDHIHQDPDVVSLIEKFGDGILLTQKGNMESFPYSAYLSWNKLWHGYGNVQAYAMLKAGKLLERDDFIKSALAEANHFYPYILDEGYIHHFYLEKINVGFKAKEMHHFPQIAYSIRPLVYACLEAYNVTFDKKYIEMAERIASWLSGNNPAGKMMYDPSTGRCFDGIVSKTEVNKNAGAESTVEALLTIQAIENHPVADINHVYEKH